MRLLAQNLFATVLLLTNFGCYDVFPAAEGRFERTLNVDGRVELEIATGSGKIDVRSGSSSVVRVVGLIRARDDWHAGAQEKVRYLEDNPPLEQHGNFIRVGRIEDETYRNNVSISYEIETPPETRLNAKTGSGAQKIEGIRGPVEAGTGSGSITMYQVSGDVNARTGSGRIELDSISGTVNAGTGSGSIRALRVTGSMKATTGSGSITLDGSAPERGGALDVEASTGSGGIEVSGVNGSLRASTGSGSITANGNPAADWNIRTSSGSATLHLPAEAAFDLYAHSSSGGIHVDHPVTVTGSVSRNEMRGKVRGGGNLVEVHTSSGGIRIQ